MTSTKAKTILTFLSRVLPLITYSLNLQLMTLECSATDLELICMFLKKHSMLRYTTLTAITGLDFPTRFNRFEVIYDVYSTQYNSRLRLYVKPTQLQVTPSIQLLYPSAPWWEREIWDLFGIYFQNHKNLTRLLTDYGFEGFPLRKDFPVSGYYEIAYLFKKQTCTYIPVALSQHMKKTFSPTTSFH